MARAFQVGDYNILSGLLHIDLEKRIPGHRFAIYANKKYLFWSTLSVSHPLYLFSRHRLFIQTHAIACGTIINFVALSSICTVFFLRTNVIFHS